MSKHPWLPHIFFLLIPQRKPPQVCVHAAVFRCQQQHAVALGEAAAYLDWRLPGALPPARLRGAVDALLARRALQVEHPYCLSVCLKVWDPGSMDAQPLARRPAGRALRSFVSIQIQCYFWLGGVYWCCTLLCIDANALMLTCSRGVILWKR